MKHAPAFDFYPERWLAGVALFSDAEQLAYLRLLCHQWLSDGLPSNSEALRRLGGKGVTEQLLAKFPLCDDGKRRNAELEENRKVKNKQRYWIVSNITEYQKRRREANAAIRKATTRVTVLASCGWKCANCGNRNDLTIDHIKPVSRGGSDELENLQALCRPCNSKKGASC